MILESSTTYWSTGIVVRYDGQRWGGRLDFYDDGFANDDPDAGAVATEGSLRTRYMVREGKHVPALRAVVDTLIADAQRLGIQLQGPAQSRPSLSYIGDGEDPASPPPTGWRETLAAEVTRLGWDPEPEQIVALVTVDERGRLTPESTVTVGEWSWPVPETYGTVIWLHRVGRTLRDHGWSVTGEPRPGTEAGLYEVPVRKIETNET